MSNRNGLDLISGGVPSKETSTGEESLFKVPEIPKKGQAAVIRTITKVEKKHPAFQTTADFAKLTRRSWFNCIRAYLSSRTSGRNKTIVKSMIRVVQTLVRFYNTRMGYDDRSFRSLVDCTKSIEEVLQFRYHEDEPEHQETAIAIFNATYACELALGGDFGIKCSNSATQTQDHRTL